MVTQVQPSTTRLRAHLIVLALGARFSTRLDAGKVHRLDARPNYIGKEKESSVSALAGKRADVITKIRFSCMQLDKESQQTCP